MLKDQGAQDKAAAEQKPSHQIAAPTISLPKGGGAIRGMGEKFAANPVTGTGSMSVPIATSPGRSGFGPQLTLSYDSGAGNGPFGFGWSLSLPSITRKTDKGLPTYQDTEDSDVFILSGSEDLVPVLAKNGSGEWVAEAVPERGVGNETYAIRRYRPRIEGLFARIERWTNIDKPDDVFWRSISKDNITTWYGKTSKSRIQDPTDPSRIFSWLICQSYDDKGNVLVYGYKTEDSKKVDASQAHERNRTHQTRSAQRYLKRIRYGNRKPFLPELKENKPWPEPPGASDKDASEHWLFEAVFDYDEPHYQEQAPDGEQRVFATASPTESQASAWPVRPDPFSTYRAGFEVRTYRRCQRVLMFHHFHGEDNVGKDCLVRSTDFTYEFETDPTIARAPIYSFVSSVTQSGYVRQGDRYLKKSLPPVEFSYSKPEVHDLVEAVDPDSVENLPTGLDGSAYQWTDLHGEGIPGILSEQGGAWFYKRNWSPIPVKQPDDSYVVKAKFAAVETVALKPNVELSAGAQFMDLAGDGQPDLVTLDGPTPGFYEHDDAEGWAPFRPFTSRLNREMGDPNLKLVDLDGDGHADVFISEDEVFVWHPSLAEEGFGPGKRVAQALDEEKGPRLVFADGEQSIYLADLSGDGLTDLVRIRNGEVCYWPNLGYGRFGAKVTMDHGPWFDHPDQFEQKRIRLADIDGSGTTDIIYLHRGGVRLYFNQSGNSWSQAQSLSVFPRIDELVAITPVDLLGNGTACLVWSSPLPGDAPRPLRYVNLMGGRKPHLLIKTVNNLGAETEVEYAPSTKFYLEDKLAGMPWITKLPFPVHVVERVVTHDRISRNRFTTRYTYHHGYYDGDEREFRGFGRVDQFDTEELAALTKDDSLPEANNLDGASHVPPVETRTWFHTGAYLAGPRLEARMKAEYYAADPHATFLDDTPTLTELAAGEEREACRSLKGSMLRQEVYADDAGPGATPEQIQRARTPYTVTEQNLTVKPLQPKAGQRHAVLFVHPREALTYHYERNPNDPRIQHACTLEVDDFGNVLKSVAIGYGRRQSAPRLPTDIDRAKQTSTLIAYTESEVTNAVGLGDDHRTPLPAAIRTYELTGLKPATTGGLFTFDEWAKDSFRLITSATEIPYEGEPNNASKQKRLIEHVQMRYRKDDLTELLPRRELDPLALPGESYKLAFTPGLIHKVFTRDGQALLPTPANLLEGTGADEGGYVDLDGDNHWWIPSARLFYSPGGSDEPATELRHARDHFFLPHRYRDPFKQITTVTYDQHDLLVRETKDAVNNTVLAKHDYRVLQPKQMTDPNGNRSVAAYDALGLVVGTAVMGKPAPAPVEGDSLEGFTADVTPAQLDQFMARPRQASANANESAATQIVHQLLGNATTRIVYDLDRFTRTGEPPVAATLARETHVSDLQRGQVTKIQISFSYSDGFGREIQKKVQAEPSPVEEGGSTVALRWVASGWTIFNNKGKPVRQYEPFFSATHDFEFGMEVGVSPVLFYDPVERVVATLHPNHTYEKVIFDPWQQTTYDVNDTCAARNAQTGDPRTDPDIRGYTKKYFEALPVDPTKPWQTWHAQRIGGAMGLHERNAAQRAAAHADTPTTAHLDALGRPFLTIAHNKVVCANHPLDGTETQVATRVDLDIEGNQRDVRDAIEQNNDQRGRIVMQYDYDIAGNRIHQASMEAGARWMLNDVTGKPIRAWDSRGFLRRFTYDVLRRPTGLFVTERGTERLAEATVYGERQGRAKNHLGKVYQVKDGAGIVTNGDYDFKGNLKQSARQVADDFNRGLDWNRNEPVGSPFATSTTYDALNRPIAVITPDNSVTRPIFNEANLLNEVSVTLRGESAATVFVRNIDYNEKGQRERIDYGNGTTTTYEYDRDTFRLTRLSTRRQSDNASLQDLRYTYDPAGNITHIQDEAQQTVYFRNQRVDPHNDYTYDAIYRLIEATGREHRGQVARPETTWNDEGRVSLPHPHDGQALRSYTERYEYDAVGNFLRLFHQAENGDWTRTYTYDEESQLESTKHSNRLTSTTVGGATETYSVGGNGYDLHGNMLHMAHLPNMQSDFEDQLTKVDLSGGGTAYYVYDAAGQRVRKVIERQSGAIAKEERIYVGGFEVFRQFNSSGVTLERETLHVMDDKQRIALVETKTIDTQSSVLIPQPLQRYQMGNHLGSCSLELSNVAEVISYEEYFPYGSTSYQAMSQSIQAAAKRYRYTGKERDEETGFTYHGARYYAPWLGRWTKPDPSDVEESVNLYVSTLNNPIRLIDLNGRDSEPAQVPIHPDLRDEFVRLERLRLEENKQFHFKLVESQDRFKAYISQREKGLLKPTEWRKSRKYEYGSSVFNLKYKSTEWGPLQLELGFKGPSYRFGFEHSKGKPSGLGGSISLFQASAAISYCWSSYCIRLKADQYIGPYLSGGLNDQKTKTRWSPFDTSIEVVPAGELQPKYAEEATRLHRKNRLRWQGEAVFRLGEGLALISRGKEKLDYVEAEWEKELAQWKASDPDWKSLEESFVEEGALPEEIPAMIEAHVAMAKEEFVARPEWKPFVEVGHDLIRKGQDQLREANRIHQMLSHSSR